LTPKPKLRDPSPRSYDKSNKLYIFKRDVQNLKCIYIHTTVNVPKPVRI
jgi:hypothetical protein